MTEREQKFAAFAKECGLKHYPDPNGDRYLYRVDGEYGGKKSERLDFMDALWQALVKAKGGNDELLID